jgi:hypothetical protein
MVPSVYSHPLFSREERYKASRISRNSKDFGSSKRGGSSCIRPAMSYGIDMPTSITSGGESRSRSVSSSGDECSFESYDDNTAVQEFIQVC